MDERLILMTRIQALIQELGRAEKAVEQIDPDLGKLVRGVFFDLFEEQRDALKRLQQDVNDLPLKECWLNFRNIRRKCDPLFRECLALMQGSLVRRSGLDDGMCKIADALLYELSSWTKNISWGRFTILAGEEFTTDMADIIRVRFPDVSIWNLPVTAHEFGHFVGPKIEKGMRGRHYHPFQDFLKKMCEQDKRCSSFLHEHFADLFATYALGPCYACTCILLRFDPYTAYVDKNSHPSDSKRVYWILKVLNQMDEADGGKQRSYRGIIDYLEECWQKSLEVVGKPERFEECLGKDTTRQLDKWMDGLYLLVDDKLSGVSGVRYSADDWVRAKMLSKQLLKDTPIEAVGEYTLIDVLNAAWCSRIQPGCGDSARVQRIGERAVKFCYKIGDISYD